jgi:hypothetical protein
MFSLLICLLWILFTGLAWAQEPTAVADADPVIQEQPAQTTGQTGDHASGMETMTDIHDINPLVAVPSPLSPWVIALWVGLFILAAGLIFGGWFLWKKRKKPRVQEVEAMLSPEDEAFSKLQGLSPDTTDGKAFYFQLSAIFREYLHGRFDIDGLEMTTEELLPHVEVMALERDLKREMKRFLVSGDPVKFAGAPAHRDMMTRDLDFVRGVVEKTAAALAAQEEAPGDARNVSE